MSEHSAEKGLRLRGPIRWLRVTRGIPWKKRLRHHINLVRWTLDRCDGCGHRFAWKGDARHGQNSQTFHGPCLQAKTWRSKAEERMAVLELVCDVWDVRADDVRELMANRQTSEGASRSRGWDLAWRVFYDMERNRTRVTPPDMGQA